MTKKLSQLATESTFALTDFVVKVKAGGAGDVLVTLQDLIEAVGASFDIPYKFSAYKNASTQTVNTGSATKVTFDVEEYDTGGNLASSTFTAPAAGWYEFTASLGYNAVGSGTRLLPQLYKNGAEIKRFDDRFTNALAGQAPLNVTVQLAQGDTIDLYATPVGANTVINNSSINTWFQGRLISKT